MTLIFYTVLSLLFHNHAKNSEPQKAYTAKDIVQKSIRAMGGSEKLRNLNTLEFEGIGHTYFLEQSERPEGPWIVNYTQVLQTRDYKNERLFLKKESRNAQQKDWKGQVLLFENDALAIKISEDQILPARPGLMDEVMEILKFAPEQVLLNAVHSTDLQILKDTLVQGVPHHNIALTLEGVKLKIFINQNTLLPTLLQTFKKYPQDIMWSVWGTVRTDTYYSYWSLTPENIYYPLQYNVFRNGQPFQELTIVDLKINPPVIDSLFSIPQRVKEAYAALPTRNFSDLPLGIKDQPAQEIVPGIYFVPGYWNVSFIKQDDGVLLLEAPISRGYTARAIEEARKVFPASHLKGVITTSDAWPHIAGIPECAFENLSIYALDLNESILQRVISTTDSSGEKYNQIKAITGKTNLGSGINRAELYPISGETGERMMMVYFPEHRLLYASDLVQRNRDGSFFQRIYLAEIIAAIERHGLQVKNLFAMHTGVIPYAEIVKAFNKHNQS